MRYIKEILAISALFILLNSFLAEAAPAPNVFVINNHTKECKTFWAGDEYIRYELPSEWGPYPYTNYPYDYWGVIYFVLNTDEEFRKSVCDSFGYEYKGLSNLSWKYPRTYLYLKKEMKECKFFILGDIYSSEAMEEYNRLKEEGWKQAYLVQEGGITFNDYFTEACSKIEYNYTGRLEVEGKKTALAIREEQRALYDSILWFVSAAIIFSAFYGIFRFRKLIIGKLKLPKIKLKSWEVKEKKLVMKTPKNKFLAAFAYLFSLFFGWSGYIVFLKAKENYTKFHGIQAFLLGIIIAAINVAIVLFSAIFLFPTSIAEIKIFLENLLYVIISINVVYILLSIGLGILAYIGRLFKIPLIGNYCENFMKRFEYMKKSKKRWPFNYIRTVRGLFYYILFCMILVIIFLIIPILLFL